ncbi:MAG: hypothetical protein GEV11_24490 [Streptosporangiales bacterium]|nr:hypothetical protein [Streptosporangiales bacterium]
MSNSLLYLAIVAVWAVVLVPMLLRRDAAAAGGRRLRPTRRRPDELGAHDADDFDAADETGHEHPGHPDHEAGVAYDDLDAYRGPRYDGPARDDHETETAGHHAGGHADEPRHTRGRAGVEAYPETEEHPGGDERERREPPAPRPVRAGRAAIIARRRRRTTGLAGLLIATATAVTLGLGPWWTMVPPILLLTGHLSLLRAAVRMDAERRRAAALRRRRDAGRRAAEGPVRTGEDPSAEIIDITAARQEPYDQYADAHLRAVGD